MPRKRFKLLTEEEFRRVKELQAQGFTTGKIAEVLNRSSSTIWYLFQCDSLQAYYDFIAKRDNRPLKPPKKPPTTDELLTNVLDELKQIKKELALVPKRRKW